MLHGQAITQLEESLAISLNELVKNRAARRSSDCLKDIAHGTLYTQAVTCLSHLMRHQIPMSLFNSGVVTLKSRKLNSPLVLISFTASRKPVMAAR